MGKGAKRKGSQFERDAVKKLQSLIPGSDWKRIPTSGAMGTIMGEPLLAGDIRGRVNGFSTRFVGEAKVGYGGENQLTLQRAWLEKIKQEAQQTYSIPFLIGKFSGSRGTVKEFIVLDIETFAGLLNTVAELDKELVKMSEHEQQNLEPNKDS